MCGCGYFSKYFFTWKYIKIIFFILKKLFLISTHQNDLKIKKILIWSKKNNFFQKRFWNAKTNRVLRNSVIKACKNCFLKTMFQIQFFNGSHNKKKHNLIYYKILYFFAPLTQKLKVNKFLAMPNGHQVACLVLSLGAMLGSKKHVK